LHLLVADSNHCRHIVAACINGGVHYNILSFDLVCSIDVGVVVCRTQTRRGFTDKERTCEREPAVRGVLSPSYLLVGSGKLFENCELRVLKVEKENDEERKRE
jgi:hypothetical protein